MKKLIIGVVVILMLLIAGLFIYFALKPKPNPVEVGLTDANSFMLNLNAVNENFTHEAEKLEIKLSNGQIYHIKTNINEFESIRVPRNISFTIYNINSSKYYTGKLQWNYDDSLMSGGFKIDYPLTTIGLLNITADKELDKSVVFTVNSTNNFKNIHICVRWSPNIIYSKIPEFIESPIPKRLNNKVDMCYDSKKSLINSESFNFTLDTFYSSIEKDKDYVNLYFIDEDLDYTTEQMTAGEEYDVGASDIIFKLK